VNDQDPELPPLVVGALGISILAALAAGAVAALFLLWFIPQILPPCPPALADLVNNTSTVLNL